MRYLKVSSITGIGEKYLSCILIASFCMTTLADDEYSKVASNQTETVLFMIASETEGNYQKIETWEGIAAFENFYIYYNNNAKQKLDEYIKNEPNVFPSQIKEVYEGTIEFRVDLKKDFLYKSMKRPKSSYIKDVDEGVIYDKNTGPLDTVIIKKPNYIIKSYVYSTTKEGVVLERKAKKQNQAGGTESSPRSTGKSFDPREMFYINNMPVWELIHKSLSYAQDDTYKDNIAIDVEESTSFNKAKYRVKISLQNDMPGIDYIINFSEDVGFNMTSYSVYIDNNKIGDVTTDYINISDIFVPVTIHELIYEENGGRLKYETAKKLSHININKTIPESIFEDENCGLFEGDLLEDYTSGLGKDKKIYKMENGKLREYKKN